MQYEGGSDGPFQNQGHEAPSPQDHEEHDQEPDLGYEDEVAQCCDGAQDETCFDENCDAMTCCDAENESPCRCLEVDCCTALEERCDKKCIIAAAAAECEKTCDDDGAHDDAADHKHAHDKDGHHPASACSTHLRKAFEQYSAYLLTARCICRSVYDRGLPTSCSSVQPAAAAVAAASALSMAKKRREATEARTPKHAQSQYKHHHHHHHHHHHRHIKRRGQKARGACKHDMAIKPDRNDQPDQCSGHDIDLPSAPAKEQPTAMYDAGKDIERDAGLEHVALVVNGMDCSGCGNKLEYTLKTMSGVSGVRVNFVMGKAEFRFDSAAGRAEDAIRGAERATGYQCTRMLCKDQTLDILASRTPAKVLANLAIPGVSDVNMIDKKMARVTYDPAVVGARTLFNKLGSITTGLAPPRNDPSVANGNKRMYDQLIKTAVSTTLTIPVVILAWSDTLVDGKTRSTVSIVLATIVQLIAVPDFYKPAISSLIHSGAIEMDMLVVISITAAYLYSIVAFAFRMANRPLDTSEFFETSTLLVTLVLLGRLGAAYARIRAVAAVSLRSLQASTAVVLEGGKDVEIDARLLQYGDKFKLLPHSAVPTDGVVIDGSSEVDESMLTGESIPVAKKQRDTVIAGTINGSGTLIARLTRLPGKNTVTDIAELVEEAANSKPKIQDIADRVASWFAPVVTSVAVIVTIVWVIVGLRVRQQSADRAVSVALTYAVAVLAVSCPCALGLAVPMVLVVASGHAARCGVIIKSAECTERARKVTDVVFDKTGTITEADLDVHEEEFLTPNHDEARAIAKALVAGNKHPVSVALAKHLAQSTTPDIHLSDTRVIPGAGVKAILDGQKVSAGNPAWTNVESLSSVVRLQNAGMTILIITRDSAAIAIFGFRTRLRSEAAKVVAQLSHRNIAVHLVSGDQKRAVETAAAQVGISHVASQRNPAQKREYVASLMSEGKAVMFVGDGINDAVAITQANVGVHLGNAASASEVTRGAADVVLLAGLEGVPAVLDVSRSSFRRMVFNFVWSAVYNIIAILLAAGAFVNARIPPAYAGLGEIVSVLPVILAAMTMLTKKIGREA